MLTTTSCEKLRNQTRWEPEST